MNDVQYIYTLNGITILKSNKMEDPGEQLVGEYLRAVKNCDFIEYNLQIKFVQGEIDVVGIDSNNRKIYICEVATHLETGLQYVKNNKPDNVARFLSKFSKNIKYAKKHFSEFQIVFMLWTPIIRIPKKEGTMHSQLRDIEMIKDNIKKKYDVDVELVYNEIYLNCIKDLRKAARTTTQAMSSPIMRFLQIEEKLHSILKSSNTLSEYPSETISK